MPDPLATLAVLGWNPDLAEAFSPYAADGCEVGRVTRVDRGAVTVETAAGAQRAVPPRADPADPAGAPAVGDWVALRDGAVVGVLPRRSAIQRDSVDRATAAQVVAANVDTVFVVVALGGAPRLRRVERFLALAWQSGAVPVVVLTKADLSADLDADLAATETAAVGVPIHPVSVPAGVGLEALDAYLTPGHTIALLGTSGAGKSTLVNHLLGEERLATAEIRGDGKGRHTTTHRELVVLPRGGLLLDTPGMRGLALWDAAEGIEATYADIEELAEQCRFADCAHGAEPGCAVTEAVAWGRLDAARLEGYHKLQREQQRLANRLDARARAEEHRRVRVFHRALRKQPYR